ncbi:hypothetical protein E2C01_063386 [Portunus trituberculatus]|uniref:Uncharacterized protein n=1 Tax=Portunus trituberculatus TaxID=210409 RepID=A0A5B7H904_PORTR|nr:hypothetical protein [Portunus trituberculatus]
MLTDYSLPTARPHAGKFVSLNAPIATRYHPKRSTEFPLRSWWQGGRMRLPQRKDYRTAPV